MEDHTCVQRNQLVCACEQRVNFDVSDSWILNYKFAEANHEFFELGKIDGLASAHAFERLKDSSIFHRSARQGSGERRQGVSAVVQHFH